MDQMREQMMEQMVECMLAEIRTNQAKTDGTLNEMKANQQEMIAKLEVWLKGWRPLQDNLRPIEKSQML
jgi:hypothetical protein